MNKPCLCSVVDASIRSLAEITCNPLNIWILHNSWNSRETESKYDYYTIYKSKLHPYLG